LDAQEEYQAQTDDENYKIYHAALIGGTTADEKDLIDKEVERDGKGYELKYLGPAPRMPAKYEMIPEDINLKMCPKDKIWKTPKGGQKDSLEVDPPGSGTPLDALKFPNRLIEKANRSASKFPEGWDEEAINSIPDLVFVEIRQDLLITLPYELLMYRPETFLFQLPDSAPFWDTYDALSINAFVSKAKKERDADAAVALLLLAHAPVEFAPSAPNGTRRLGIDAPTDFPAECCKDCAKYGAQCDGVKPRCNQCKKKGRKCNFTEPMKTGDVEIEVKESYLRSGSEYARQQDWANLGSSNSMSVSEARLSAYGHLTGLDQLVLAGEVVEARRARRVQGNLSKAALNSGLDSGPGFSSTPRLSQNTARAQAYPTQGLTTRDPGFAALAQGLKPHDVTLNQAGTLTYMVMTSQEESFHSRPSIRINVPDHLKNLLVDDWENVTKSLLLVPLPSQAPANYIIDEYFNEEKMNRRLGSAEADILEEFCAGLKMYFEKAVGKILLYRFERSQLAEVCTVTASPFISKFDPKQALTITSSAGPQALGIGQAQGLGRQRPRRLLRRRAPDPHDRQPPRDDRTNEHGRRVRLAPQDRAQQVLHLAVSQQCQVLLRQIREARRRVCRERPLGSGGSHEWYWYWSSGCGQRCEEGW
jgi:hypothetical protein